MKKQMLSRLFAVMCVVVLAFSLTACGSDKKAVESAAKTFMTYCDDGDFTSAQKMCSSSVARSFNIDRLDEKYQDSVYSAFSNEGIQKSDLSPSTQNAIDDLLKYVKKSVIKSYTINDDYDDDTKSLTVKVTMISDFDSSSYNDAVSSLGNAYVRQHQSELMSTYASGGEKALMVKILDGIMPEAVQQAKTKMIDSATTQDYIWKLTFKKNKSGDWIIVRVKETRVK